MKLILLAKLVLFQHYFVVCDNQEESKIVIEHYRKEMEDDTNDPIVKRYQENCDKLGTNPYFDMDQVLEKVWRIYRTWEVPPMPTKCIDVTFVIPNAKVKESVQAHIAPYLVHTPNWAAAALYMSMGRASQDILLFTDNGPAGRFSGVPAGIRDDLFPRSLHKNVIFLLQFQFKLLEGGRFLVILDCKSGTAMLLASAKERVSTNETQVVAEKLAFGGLGSPSCQEPKPTFTNVGVR